MPDLFLPQLYCRDTGLSELAVSDDLDAASAAKQQAEELAASSSKHCQELEDHIQVHLSMHAAALPNPRPSTSLSSAILLH